MSRACLDTCPACHGYIKTFDLRAPGTKEVVPLVDDVAKLPLDLARIGGLRAPLWRSPVCGTNTR